jgi:tetratricopeptide (TPR) repeat protein
MVTTSFSFPIMIRATLLRFCLPLLGAGAVCSAQVYPLTEHSFSNAQFREAFMASYLAVQSELNPSITPQEKGLFDELIPLIQGNPRAAIARLQAAITPESSAAFDYILGNLHYQEGNMTQAVRAYEAAARKFPNYQTAYFNMGRALVQDGRFADALKPLQTALRLRGGDGTLYGLIGYCYLNEGRFATALDAYRMAVMLSPENRDWKIGKLRCHEALGQAEETIGMLYEFIAAEPRNTDWWKMQANQFLAKGDQLRAAANLQVVRQFGSTDAPTLVLLGDILLNEELFEPALSVYLEALETPNVRIARILRVVDTLVQFDETERAKTLLAKAETTLGDSLPESEQLDLLNLKARVALATQDSEGAGAFLEEIVRRDPMNGRALLSLADLHSKAGDLARAEFYAENAAKVEAFAHRASLLLAQLKVQQKDYRAAATFLRRAQQIEPRDYVADYLMKVEQAALRM